MMTALFVGYPTRNLKGSNSICEICMTVTGDTRKLQHSQNIILFPEGNE